MLRSSPIGEAWVEYAPGGEGGGDSADPTGLRREEVAELAGIGVDWYVGLEQGRAVSPSAATIEALAVALRLGPVEHTHLRALSRHATRRPFLRERVPAPIRRAVERLVQPAYVTARRWDVLAWNAAAEIFPALMSGPVEDRNVLLYMLTDPEARRLFGSTWTRDAKRIVATFRTTHNLWPKDPAFVGLLDRLRCKSAEFPAWWDAHDILPATAGRKVLRHPTTGSQHYEYTSFQANDDPALKLVMYTPL